MPIPDHEFLKRLRVFGGYQRVLDPTYTPTEEVYKLFELAGYERSKLDRMRLKEPKPERDAWIESISERLHWTWRMSTEHITFIPKDWVGIPGFTPGVTWHQFPTFETWEDVSSVMLRLAIDVLEIDEYIDAHPERFPPLELKRLR